MPKLSFIIPIYNVEKYLKKCLDAIYSQISTNENDFEVICINDCTTDNSREILFDYKRKHNNIRLIDHTENKKAGGARNTGIEAAIGEWVWFVDADDTIEPDAIKKVLYYCQKDDLDALCFNYQLLYENRTVAEHVFDDSAEVQSGVNFLLSTFGDGLIYHLGYPVRTVYRRSVLLERDIRFPEQLLYGEDTIFMAEGVMYAKRVKAISDVLYNYRQGVVTSSSAQLVEMKGERIYESIFRAGALVMELKNKARGMSQELATAIEKGLPWFVNRLFMRLVKTSGEERSVFYNSLKINTYPHYLLSYMNRQNCFVVEHPQLGRILLWIISKMYKIKHK